MQEVLLKREHCHSENIYKGSEHKIIKTSYGNKNCVLLWSVFLSPLKQYLLGLLFTQSNTSEQSTNTSFQCWFNNEMIVVKLQCKKLK